MKASDIPIKMVKLIFESKVFNILKKKLDITLIAELSLKICT